MARGQKQYTKEFKHTIVELYNAGKSLAELSSEYALSKSTITGWVKKNKPIAVDKDTTITAADYQAVLKKMARLEEENEKIEEKIIDIHKESKNALSKKDWHFSFSFKIIHNFKIIFPVLFYL